MKDIVKAFDQLERSLKENDEEKGPRALIAITKIAVKDLRRIANALEDKNDSGIRPKDK